MKALVYHSSRGVRVEQVTDPMPAVAGNRMFDEKQDHCRKVVLTT